MNVSSSENKCRDKVSIHHVHRDGGVIIKRYVFRSAYP